MLPSREGLCEGASRERRLLSRPAPAGVDPPAGRAPRGPLRLDQGRELAGSDAGSGAARPRDPGLAGSTERGHRAGDGRHPALAGAAPRGVPGPHRGRGTLRRAAGRTLRVLPPLPPRRAASPPLPAPPGGRRPRRGPARRRPGSGRRGLFPDRRLRARPRSSLRGLERRPQRLRTLHPPDPEPRERGGSARGPARRGGSGGVGGGRRAPLLPGARRAAPAGEGAAPPPRRSPRRGPARLRGDGPRILRERRHHRQPPFRGHRLARPHHLRDPAGRRGQAALPGLPRGGTRARRRVPPDPPPRASAHPDQRRRRGGLQDRRDPPLGPGTRPLAGPRAPPAGPPDPRHRGARRAPRAPRARGGFAAHRGARARRRGGTRPRGGRRGVQPRSRRRAGVRGRRPPLHVQFAHHPGAYLPLRPAPPGTHAGPDAVATERARTRRLPVLPALRHLPRRRAGADHRTAPAGHADRRLGATAAPRLRRLRDQPARELPGAPALPRRSRFRVCDRPRARGHGARLPVVPRRQGRPEEEHLPRLHRGRRTPGGPGPCPARCARLPGRQRGGAAGGRGAQPAPGPLPGRGGGGALRRRAQHDVRRQPPADPARVARMGQPDRGPAGPRVHPLLLSLRQRRRQGLPPHPRHRGASATPG